MKKKQTLLFSILILSIALCGCGSTLPEMSESEVTMITEYATHLMVKYSPIADRTLLNDEQLEIEIAREEEEAERLRKTKEIEQAYMQAAEKGQQVVDDAAEMNEESKQTPVSTPSRSISEFYEVESLSIEYTDKILCDSYPEESSEEVFMAMDATEGKQLLVVEFSVKNMSSSEQELNMLDKQSRFAVRMEDGSVIPAQSTLLLNDLSSFVGTISTDSEQEMALVFEVPDSITDVETLDLIMSNQTGDNVVALE